LAQESQGERSERPPILARGAVALRGATPIAMEKYRKVEKQQETVVKDDDEIRVTAAGSVSAYVSRAAKVFNELEKPQVCIKASGNALTKAVTLAEVVKRRFKDLHQITTLGSTQIVDEYEPLEEGLDKVIDTRTVSVIEIKLSKESLDASDKGYQPPIDQSLVTEFEPDQLTKARGRGRGSKGRGKGRGKGKGKKGRGKGADAEDEDEDEEEEDSPARGKGKKGKGKGKKGKGKGKSKWEDDDDGPPRGKGKGKGKGKDGKGKGKGKSWEREAYPSKGKGKKGKGKSSSWEDWGEEDYYSGGYGSSKGKGKKGKKIKLGRRLGR